MIFTNNLSPMLFDFGLVQVRWYGLMFAAGLLLGYLFIHFVFKKEKYPQEHLDSIVLYLFVGMVVGARLGHVFFYEAAYYLAHPVDIVKVWNGGLSSHGGAIGVFLAYLTWAKVHKVKFSKYVDAIVMGIPVLAAFVRFGNFFNSEIYGLPTNANFGVIFSRLGEDFPRHPSQLYEAFLNLGIFVLFVFLYKKYGKKLRPMFFLFTYLLLYFGGRFFLEFYKDLHGPLTNLPITMGQLLSIVPVILALLFFGFFYKKRA